MSTEKAEAVRHWLEVRTEDQRVWSQVVCEDPTRCPERWESDARGDSGCLIADGWTDQGEDLLAIPSDMLSADGRGPLVGRIEIGYRWEGHAEPDLYVEPKVSADADWDAMWQLASAAVDVVWQQNTGSTMPSTRACAQAAVRALWEAGYRRYGATPPVPEAETSRVDDGICRRTDLAVLTTEKNCPDCGHWPMAHSIPPRQMPDDACQICMMVSLANRFGSGS